MKMIEGSLNDATTQAYKIKMKKVTLELTEKGRSDKQHHYPKPGMELDRLYSYRHFTIGASLAKSAS